MGPKTEDITIFKENNVILCYINTFSERLKKMIKDGLTVVCYGPSVKNAENPTKIYPFENTIKSFEERYTKKTNKLKKGMLGELLAHTLINNYIDKLSTLSPFFNKEEANIRKGFDMLYLDSENKCIRYGEVKSGEINENETVNRKNKDLLHKASSDLECKLKDKERFAIWDNAKIDIALSQKLDLLEILCDDQKSCNSNDKRAILVSVCFHDINDKIELQTVKDFYDNHEKTGTFADTMVFSIQKDTLQKIEHFLLEECQS